MNPALGVGERVRLGRKYWVLDMNFHLGYRVYPPLSTILYEFIET